MFNLLDTKNKSLIANFQGIPKNDLTWQEVFDMNLNISFAKFPRICPNCGLFMKEYKSAYEKIENSGQYMVRGIFCPSGDFTYLDCA